MAVCESYPKESPIYGGYQYSMLVASENCSHMLYDSGRFYLAYEGSEWRHVTKISSVTYKQANNLIAFTGITPGHNKAEDVSVTLYKLQDNYDTSPIASSSHCVVYDGYCRLAQFLLNCHLNDQLHRLGEDDLEEICQVKLLDLSPSEHALLDNNLTSAFKHAVNKHETNNISLLYQSGSQGIRAQDTLVHFACRYGLQSFVKFLLKLPCGEECLTTLDTDGQLPVDVAKNAGHVDFVNVLLSNEDAVSGHEDDKQHFVSSEIQNCPNLKHDILKLNRLLSVNTESLDNNTDFHEALSQRIDESNANTDTNYSPQSKSQTGDAAGTDFITEISVPVNDEPTNVFTRKDNINVRPRSNTSPTRVKNNGGKVLEDSILRLRQIHENIQNIRSASSKFQTETCEDVNFRPSQSWPSLTLAGPNMNNDPVTAQEDDTEVLYDENDIDEVLQSCIENKSVKIQVNDVTPSGSQELLYVKNFDYSSSQGGETVDGSYGNVKMQLEHRNKKVQKTTRRQSWSGDNEKENSINKNQMSHSSLSSMDSDHDETFFDAQDSALYSKTDSESVRQKRPNSVGDVDISSISEPACDANSSEYQSHNPGSLQCLYDGLPRKDSKPAGEDICSKSLSEHQIIKMLNAPPIPQRSLLKSISTPSIVSANDSTETWSETTVTKDDTQTTVLARKEHPAAIFPNQDSDEDKPFKRKKRSSLFFKKKWGKDLKKSSHSFVTVCYSNSTSCDACSKSLCNKQALCCEICMVKVHESTCREQISDCIKLKNSRAVTKTASYSQPPSIAKEKLTTSSSFKTPPTNSIFPNSSPHQSRSKKLSEVSLNIAVVQEAISLNSHKSNSNSPSKVINEDKEGDMLEDSHLSIVETNSASVESLEDATADDSDLDDDAELQLKSVEPEQWSNLVDKKVIKKMKERDVKRQESIYELVLTEKHHVLTLKIMQKVFAHGMKKELQISREVVDRIFPSLDNLYEIHSSFLRLLREIQKENTVISAIGKLLVQQFQFEKAVQLTQAYGDFCSRHQEAVSLYKDILKSDRKFQIFIKKCSLHPLCKARGVPECMLLVTQRITKYPLILNSILKATRENEEEKTNLQEALNLVKEVITNVNSRVKEKQKESRLIEIYNKVDAKSTGLFHGKKFKKSNLLSGKRKLLYEGTFIWKSARGKPLEVLTVVLSDIIIFLQENNQKYSFVSQDSKSGILSLQKLLIREKAGQDNLVIYLISSNPSEPEMYELGCSSSKDKKLWIENLRQAIDNYLDEGDDVNAVDFNADRKLIDVKTARVKHLLACLRDKDVCIAQICEEKMTILLELLESDLKENPIDYKYTHLFENKYDAGETRNLLMASLNEASKIANSLYMNNSNLSRSVSSVGEHQSETFISPALPKRAETFGGFDSPVKEQNPLHKTLKKKLMNLKDSEKVRGASVSCTVSPVSEEDGEHLCPVSDVRRLSGPATIIDSREQIQQPQCLKRKTNSANMLSNLAIGSHSKPKTDGSEYADASVSTSPSVIDDSVSQNDTVGELLSLNAVAPSLLVVGQDQLSAAIQLTHHLNRLHCLFSQHFTGYETLKTELAQLRSMQTAIEKEPNNRDLKEKRSLYKHNQRLEELRNLQEQLREDRQILDKEKANEKQRLELAEAELEKLKIQMREEQQDVKEQRDKLYQQLEVLKRQGILLSPSMQIMNTGLQSPPLEPESNPFSNETKGAKPDSARKLIISNPADKKHETKPRNLLSNSIMSGLNKRSDASDRQTLPVHLCSATNQQKAAQNPIQPSSFKQQIPMKLASLAAGFESAPTSPNPNWNNNSPGQGDSPQFLPMKLATENKMSKANPTRTSSFGGSPRVASSHQEYVHQRAGSSPAKMHGLAHHSEEPKLRNSTMPKEKKDIGKKYNDPKEQIIFF